MRAIAIRRAASEIGVAYVLPALSAAFSALVILFLIALLTGCASLSGDSVQYPPKDAAFDQTVYFLISSDPAGASVHAIEQAADGSWRPSTKELGKTPIMIPASMYEWKGNKWFRDCALDEGRLWSPAEEGRKHRYRFVVLKDGYYGVAVNTHLYFADASGQRIMAKEGEDGTLRDEMVITPPMCPVELIQHAREFKEQFASAVEAGDYVLAESLRERRVHELESRLQQNLEFWDTWEHGEGTRNGDVNKKLVYRELTRLKRIVGLEDEQLMELREQLLTKLKNDDLEGANKLARTIALLEKTYFLNPAYGLKETEQVLQTSEYLREQLASSSYVPSTTHTATQMVEDVRSKRGTLQPRDYRKALARARLINILGINGVF